MDSEAGRSKGPDQDQWILIKVRLALAFAVIRTRPEGMSGPQHLEQLSRQLRESEQTWREQSLSLQQDVLTVSQRALTTRETPTCSQNTDFASQDLFDAGNAECVVDSGSETPDLLLDEAEPQPVVRPPQHEASFPHLTVLQSLCALCRTTPSSRAALWYGPDSGSMVAESVCQLLDCVLKACREAPTLGSHDLILEACQVAVGAVELLGSCRSVDFRNHLDRVMKELTGLLLHHIDCKDVETLMEYLLVLGSSSILRPSLIHYSVSEISTLTDQLWQAFQGEPSGHWLPLKPYLSSCGLLSVLEKLAQRLEAWERAEVSERLKDTVSELLRRVFPLSREFPLFSVRLWSIAGLLSSS